jgi:glycosyltransferase involved in cell wall biosynthesis
VKLGLIARADNRGLGQQTWELHRHLNPAKTLVVNCPSAKPLPLRLERFPDATVVDRFPTAQDFRDWLPGLDVVLTCETPYGPLYQEADRLGVKTVNQFNFEFLERTGPTATLYAAPSMWHYDDVPFNKCFLPVPIATDRFTMNQADEAKRFLHIVGRPAIHDRNGTKDLIAALRYVQSPITLTIRCQEPGYVENMIHNVPSHVAVNVRSGDVENYWDNYLNQDVLIMPRRFGGLCLPANEALGAGMPVIMPNIEPNNLWLPDEWLVPANQSASFMAKTRIDLHETQPQALAGKIDEFTNPTFYTAARKNAQALAQRLSWDTLKPEYDKVFTNLCSVSV